MDINDVAEGNHLSADIHADYQGIIVDSARVQSPEAADVVTNLSTEDFTGMTHQKARHLA